MPQLVLRYHSGEEKVIDLQGGEVRIGRDPDNDISLEDELISTHHACLTRESDGCYSLKDLGSQNGTYVNGSAVQSKQLRDGDVITFATCQVSFLDPATARPGKITQRISFETLAQQSASFWTATVENKRKELEDLERRIKDAESSLAKAENLPDQAGQEQLAEDVARLEQRQKELLARNEDLENLTGRDLPEAERRLTELKRSIAESEAELESSRKKVLEVEQLQEQLPRLQNKIDSLYREHDYKKATLEKTTDEALEAESRLAKAQAQFEEVQAKETAALAKTEKARLDYHELSKKKANVQEELEAARTELRSLKEQLAAEAGKAEDLALQNEILTHEYSQLDERIKLAEVRLADATADWDEIERTRLEDLLQQKNKLESDCEAAEERLETAKEQLHAVRERIRIETEEAEAHLTDLRENHYEPTRELLEELSLRNEDLVREIAEREQKLERLVRAIDESESIEQLLREVLAKKGRALKSLEKRIGEEVEKIAAEAAGHHEPRISVEPPTLSGFGPIFVAKDRPAAPLAPMARPDGQTHHPPLKLVVLEPASRHAPRDFTGCEELSFVGDPLPIGFAGLAAATRGAYATSLAEAAKRQLPVLFVAGNELEENIAAVKKLRAALPSQPVLLGWRAKTFLNVTETLNQGANFQDLTALLSLTDGSVTTDPYMNTFFDSLNQGKRFLYLPPALPWDPSTRKPHNRRSGLYLDADSFRPDDLSHRALARELKQIVEGSRQTLTIPEISSEILERLKAETQLDDNWICTVPTPAYQERLSLLEQHLAAVTFPQPTLETEIVRDVLITRTLLLGPASEPLQVFFPEASTVEGQSLLPQPSRIVPILESAEHFNRVLRHAEKVLLETYCYQAVARKLDGFVSHLSA